MKAESRLRVVVDTNVWISAALSPSGAPAKLVHQVLEYELPVLSPQTFEELKIRLWKPEFDRHLSMELRHRILHDLNASAYWVDVPQEVTARVFCRDADDDKFIHTALAAGSDLLVTGDQDLLDLSDSPLLAGLRILPSVKALEFVGLKQ